MANSNFSDMSGYGWDFLKGINSIKASMLPMPFNIIAELPIATRGQFGAFVINHVCSSAGLNVIPHPRKSHKKPYDLKINGFRVKVKIAFESSKNKWTFNQILYPGDYDYLCCLGVFANSKGEIDGRCLLLHSKEIQHLIATIFPNQHPGGETWNWTIPSRVVPDHYNGVGTFDEIIEILSKTSTGKYMSEWGQILSLESD